MKKLFLTLLLSIAAYCVYAQQPYQQNLVDVGVISFPDKPNEETQGSATVYSLDAGPYYYFSQITLMGAQGDERMANGIYQQFLNGVLYDKNTKLIYKKTITANNITGLEAAMKGIWKGGMVYRYYQAYYLKGNLVVNAVWATDSVSVQTPAVASYLNSFKPDTTPNQVSQQSEEPVKYKLAELAGVATFFTLLFFFVACIGVMIWLITRRIKRKKASETFNHFD